MDTWTADETESTAAASLRLPHDPEAERQVLGALMIRPGLILSIAGIVGKDDFYQEGHRLIFEAIHDVGNSSAGELDAVQIIQYLTDRALIDQAGGGPYVMQLVPGRDGSRVRNITCAAIKEFLVAPGPHDGRELDRRGRVSAFPKTKTFFYAASKIAFCASPTALFRKALCLFPNSKKTSASI